MIMMTYLTFLWNCLNDPMYDGVGLAGFISKDIGFLLCLYLLLSLRVLHFFLILLPIMGWFCRVGVFKIIVASLSPGLESTALINSEIFHTSHERYATTQRIKTFEDIPTCRIINMFVITTHLNIFLMTMKPTASSNSTGKNCQNTRHTSTNEQLMSHTFCSNISRLIGNRTSTDTTQKKNIIL